jgi:hypothetical protein
MGEPQLGQLRQRIYDFLVELPGMEGQADAISDTDAASLAEWATGFIKSVVRCFSWDSDITTDKITSRFY